MRGFVATLLAVSCSAVALAGQRSPALPPSPPASLPELAPRPLETELRQRIDPATLQSQAPSANQPPQDEFSEPLSELPPEERMPAAPMVVAAYIFVLLAFFAYVFSLSRRLSAVKQDMARLETEIKGSRRP
jgi:hypothetical protein